jgi:hypothetical protein
MTTAVLTREEALTTSELAGGYSAYTDAVELGNSLATDALSQAMPTTTVLTTSRFCGADEA